MGERIVNGLPPLSGALHNPLRPGAGAAGGKEIALTIRFIIFRKIAAPATRAGGEIKEEHPLTESGIFFLFPQLPQRALVDVSYYVATAQVAPVIDVSHVAVEEGHAGTHLSIPAYGSGTAVDKGAAVARL
jgi:hypothetical protein